jgi:hypothetical protein
MGRSGCKIGGPVSGALVSTTLVVAKSSTGANAECKNRRRLALSSGVRPLAARSEG